MPKSLTLSLTKLIEATRIHPRTFLPLGQPPVTVPYGALVEPVGSDRDRERFNYLGELFECQRDLFLSATGGSKSAASEAAVAEPALEPVESKPEAPVSGPHLNWDRVRSSNYTVMRTPVPGGWLVALNGSGVTFVPDAKHRWDGGSVAK